ncbi:MAG: prepilin peptidase [Candidatus Yanofskybacteria bacterium]|nr:prepilin peptidase [Candidatus Yanofskybacteria bacterium]
MGIYFYIFIFLIGLTVGSFFNVVIFRFKGSGTLKKVPDPLWRGRSKCLNCGSVIRWFDLIPVFSYFVLKRRCRKCKIRLSLLYPIVEAATATALLLLFLNNPTVSYLTVASAFIVALLILIIFLDVRYLIIPDKILILLAVAIVLRLNLNTTINITDFYRLFTVSLSNSLIFALGLTAFFGILYIVSKGRWLGLGDIKLIFLMGFLLGYPMGYLAVVAAVWLAAIFSVILIIQKKATAKTEIPFGSFLSIATIIFIIFNNELQKIATYFQ